MEAAFGNEFGPPRKALKFRDFHKSQCTALSIMNSEKLTPNQIFSFWNKQKAHTPPKRTVTVYMLYNPIQGLNPNISAVGQRAAM